MSEFAWIYVVDQRRINTEVVNVEIGGCERKACQTQFNYTHALRLNKTYVMWRSLQPRRCIRTVFLLFAQINSRRRGGVVSVLRRCVASSLSDIRRETYLLKLYRFLHPSCLLVWIILNFLKSKLYSQEKQIARRYRERISLMYASNIRQRIKSKYRM